MDFDPDHDPGPAPSPCVAICMMNAESEVCSGCLRGIEEIIAWPSASEDYKRRVWRRIRQARLATG